MKNKIIIALATVCVTLLSLLIVEHRAKIELLDELQEYDRLFTSIKTLRLRVAFQELRIYLIEKEWNLIISEIEKRLIFALNVYTAIGEGRLQIIEARIEKGKK